MVFVTGTREPSSTISSVCRDCAVDSRPALADHGNGRCDRWALQPVRRPLPLAVRDLALLGNPIDRFVLARPNSSPS